ncbi:MAG: hypothetical protein WC502_02670 [Methanolinea sp.]
MAEDIRDLIDKIQSEGIQAAEEKARQIEDLARQRAEEIISSAKLQADRMLSDAHEKIRREEENKRALLAQAGRDLLLSIRSEINSMLRALIISDTQKALTPEALSRLLSEMILRSGRSEPGSIEIMMRKEDLESFENHYLHTLSEVTKKEIRLKSSDEISGGFIISYDNGRSWFDFSDESLADFIGEHLKPKLKNILEDSRKG